MYEKDIEDRLVDLIENHDVGRFYCGARGNFDWMCAKILYKLKTKYPFIQCIRVLSYIPQQTVDHPYFDGSVYLLERWVPPL